MHEFRIDETHKVNYEKTVEHYWATILSGTVCEFQDSNGCIDITDRKTTVRRVVHMNGYVGGDHTVVPTQWCQYGTQEGTLDSKLNNFNQVGFSQGWNGSVTSHQILSAKTL